MCSFSILKIIIKMLAESNKIVLIDDDEKELSRLSQVFYDKGIGCRKLVYDAFYDRPLSNVRILFMDINLSNANEGDDKKRNSTLKDALNLYISQDNGPYVLVFWTSNVEWKDSFLEFMKRDEEGLPVSPIFITTIAKEEFSVEKIDAIFDESPVRILFEYEEEMARSVSDATNQILNTIPKDNTWGKTSLFDENCKEVFATIAKQLAGYQFAKQDPDKAIKEALIPLYAYAFLNCKSNLWRKTLSEIFDKKKSDEISLPYGYDVALLNTIFHIDNTGSFSNVCRGVVSAIDVDKFEKFFSISFPDWFGITLPGIDKSNRKKSKPICVEISSACDFSQSKKRTNKYLLGVVCPEDIVEIVKSNEIKNDNPIKLGEYSLLIKESFLNRDEKVVFCFNLNYTFTISKETEYIMGNSICQFKKELMDMIGNRYANHISRIGITSFR